MLTISERAAKVSYTDSKQFTRAQKFIKMNRKKLEDSSVYFNPDTSLMSQDDYKNADFRILIVFGSPASVKAVSSTMPALNSFVKQICNAPRSAEKNALPQVEGLKQVPEPHARGPLNVFIDFCFVPNASDMKLFDKSNMPYAIGNVSHLDASYFDMVGFSISVLSEVVTDPNIIKSCSRCDYPIPLTWTERKDLTLGECPIIMAGGITAVCGDIMFGDLGDGRQAFVDYLYLGECVKMDITYERYIEAIKHNKALQLGAECSPYSHNDKVCEGFITNQDYIDSLFDLHMVYQPQAYKVVFDDRNMITENIKINPYAQDFVKPYYPLELESDYLGVGMTVIQANGDNTGTTQTQVSEGCSAGGACSFCMEGNYCLPAGSLLKTSEGLQAIERVTPGQMVILNGESYRVLDAIVAGEKPVLKFEMYNHQTLRVANTHLILTLQDGKLIYKRAYELKEGDFIAYERSESFGNEEIALNDSYLVGAILGDGGFLPERDYCYVYASNHEVDEMKYLLSGLAAHKHDNVWKLEVNTKNQTTRLSKLGLVHADAHSKRIPEVFFRAKKESIIQLLRGMFDTDGCVSLDKKGKPRVSYCTVSEGLAQDLVKILSMFGIRATIYKNNRKSKGHYKLNGEWIKAAEGAQDVVIVGREDIIRFRQIGFGLTVKNDKLQNSVDYAWDSNYIPTFEKRIRDLYHSEVCFNRFVRANADSVRKTINGWTRMNYLSKRHHEAIKDYYPSELRDDYEKAALYDYVQIIGIEEQPVEMMYDINVEDSHAYSLCGWVSHNTGGWVEKPHDVILSEIKEAKKYSAGYKYKPYSFNAVSASEIIPVGGGRFKLIGEWADDKVITIDGTVSEVETSYNSSHKVLKFKTHLGSCPKMSFYHKQWVLTDKGLEVRLAKDIKVGDYLPYLEGYYSQFLKEREYSKFYFLGLWYGDGVRLNGEKFTGTRQLLSVKEPELIELCVNSGMFSSTPDKVVDSNLTYTYKKEFTEFAKRYFSNYKYGTNMLQELSINEALDFIRGYYDADGSSTAEYTRFAVSIKSLPVLEWMSQVLESVGVTSRISDSYTVDGHEEVYLAITGPARKRFVEVVNPTLKKKRKVGSSKKSRYGNLPGVLGLSLNSEVLDKRKLSKFLKGKEGITFETFSEEVGSKLQLEIVDLINKGLRFKRVDSIKILPEEDTIDLIEVKNSTYSVGGVLTHNCNYVTDYKGLLYEFMKQYPKVTFINMRMQELGIDPDALIMMKMIGSNRLSCLDKDTLVTTKRGLIPIRLVTTDDEVLSLEFDNTPKGGRVNHREVWSKVVAVKNQGVKPLYRVKLQTGNSIICTNDHLFLTTSDCSCKSRYSDVRADALLRSKNKKVLLPSQERDRQKIESRKAYFAYLLGWLMGDGYVSDSCCRFYFGDKDREAQIKVKSYLEYLEVSFYEDKINGEFGEVTRLTVSKKWFVDDVALSGLAGSSVDKKFPEQMFTTSIAEQCSFLEAYFSADGSVKYGKESNRTTCCVRCSSISPSILQGVMLILNSLGIQTHQSAWKENSGGFENQHKISSLYLRKPESIRKFRDLIGFTQEYKLDKLICDSAKETRYSAAIESIEYVYDGECWDIQVEGAPYFAANNIFVHNCPLEGISPRLQNNLLNKCLSEEAINNVMNYVVHGKMVDLKVGGIFTGYEEEEDYQWICDFVDKFKKKAEAENGSFNFRLKVTPLVHYNLTPCEYWPRRSAMKSYHGEHWLTDEWYEKFREHNVFFKVNGFRWSTFIEQALLDLGRSATKWMYDNIVSQNLPVYSLRSFASEQIVNNLKKLINKDWFFRGRDPEHYISVSHRVHIDLMGSYIPRARRMVRHIANDHWSNNEPDIRCLKTYEGAQVKCYKSCISKDPLKIFTDVKLDENDNLVGDHYHELKGCERCPSNEFRMQRLARPVPQTKNSEDIEAAPRMKPMLRVRFVLERSRDYDVLNPHNTAHTFVAKLLQHSDNLLNWYHSVDKHNNFWGNDPETVMYEGSGSQVVDTLWTASAAFKEIQDLIPVVNKELKSIQIVSARKELLDEKLLVTDYNVYRFETSLKDAYELFKESAIAYKGEVRVVGDMGTLTLTQDKTLKAPSFLQIGGKVIGYVTLPMKYNPLLALQGFFVAKKINFSVIRSEFDFKCVMVARDDSAVCKCGKEKALISLTTGKHLPFGRDCLPKALLNLEKQKLLKK